VTSKLEALAHRAVACSRWRWMNGMLSAKGLRVTENDPDGYVAGYYDGCSYIANCTKGSLPDLSDPATLGCLLALVREAWGDPSVGIFRSALGQEWCVLIQKGGLQGFHAPTEAEALVAALEVAQ